MDGSLERLLAGVPAGGYGMDSFYGKSGGRNILTPGAMPFSEVGWSAGTAGALSPADFAPHPFIKSVSIGGGKLRVGSSVPNVKEYFDRITINGQVFYTSNAGFISQSRSATWNWDTGIVWTVGQPVFVTID
jgi:hypothetical protein